MKFAGLLCCRLHHQPEKFGGCGWSRTTNLSLMRRKLCRLSYTAVSQLRVQSLDCSAVFGSSKLKLELSSSFGFLEARGGVEPRAFPPSSCRFGLEDRCRERGPGRSKKAKVKSKNSTGEPESLLPFYFCLLPCCLVPEEGLKPSTPGL